MQRWAEEVLEIAEGGLERIGATNEAGEDERIYLGPMRALLEAGQTPADALLEAIDPDRPLLEQLLLHARA
jgi:gamma-glutamylcysteine synthetase